jgi:hypothetical protein
MPRPRAISIAGGESSKPSNVACGHASASASSSEPSPQPISTTLRGASPARAASVRAWAALVRAPSARQRPIFMPSSRSARV